MANTGLEAAARRLALSIVISDADIQPLVPDLFRVPTAMTHAVNCYLWLGPNGVTVVDTGWADSAPVIAHAGRADTPFIRGAEPGPWPTLTAALHLPRLGVLLTGDLVAESRGNVIVGPFNTDRDQSRRSIGRLAGTDAHIAGFGHGEAVTIDAARRLAHCTDPLA